MQDTNHFCDRAAALFARFDFIPHARIDDLMVSYAVPGGTVGPHVDSYDVFLVQGTGRRRWQVSRQKDLAFVPGLDLKILARFEPEEEWVLEPGDMLYLPPDVAHYGVAETECLTWSVGFRAPSDAELAAGFLDYLRERLDLEGRYADPGLRPARGAGRIPAAMVAHVARTLDRIRWRPRDALAFAGRFLSEPKAHVYFTPPARPLARARFRARRVAPRPRPRPPRPAPLFWHDVLPQRRGRGGAARLRGVVAKARGLAHADRDGRRAIAFWDLAHEWYARGFVHLGEERRP